MPLEGMPEARKRKKRPKEKQMPEARHTSGRSCASTEPPALQLLRLSCALSPPVSILCSPSVPHAAQDMSIVTFGLYIPSKTVCKCLMLLAHPLQSFSPSRCIYTRVVLHVSSTAAVVARGCYNTVTSAAAPVPKLCPVIANFHPLQCLSPSRCTYTGELTSIQVQKHLTVAA